MDSNGTNESNASTSCHILSQQDVHTILYTRVAVASVAFAANLATLLLMCALTCFQKTHTTFIDRLKLYLTVVTLVYSLLYIFEVLPVETQQVENMTKTVTRSRDWERFCKGCGVVHQYVSCVVLLLIFWMIVFLLWCSKQVATVRMQSNTKIRLHCNQRCLDIAVLISSLGVPLLFVWIPLITDNYGLAGVWCAIIVRRNNLCSQGSGSLLPGLGYEIGLNYGPAIILVLLCTGGMVIVVYRFWNYFKRNGSTTHETNSAIIKGIAPITYLILYNLISFTNATSVVIHNVHGSNTVNYRLWVTHAVMGPAKPLTIPFAFVISQLIIHCYYKYYKRMDLKNSYDVIM